ncbi:MAG: hypothetical protein FJ288_00745 [Planctomycetes bacterium]|nr:hypothetical protein [Planctomycetota bacterium]
MAIENRSGAAKGGEEAARRTNDHAFPTARKHGAPGNGGGTEPGMTQRRRWLVFGSNVAVAILLATVLAVAAVWLSETLLRGRWRTDLTVGGRFSLSPRTRAMLGDLKQDVTITNLYAYAPEIPESVDQWQRVQDLLSEYAAVNPSHITAESVNPAVDVGGTEQLIDRLRKRYAKELEKPKALIDEYDQLNKDLSALLKNEAKRLDAAADAWKDGPPDALSGLHLVSQKWRQMELVGEFQAAGIQAMVEQPLPPYTTAVNRAKEHLKNVSDTFAAVPDFFGRIMTLKGAGAPDEVKAVLAGAKDTYEPMRKRIEDFDKKAADIKELELDTVRREINEGQSVLIEAPDKVKVVSYDDIWVHNPDADEKNPDAPRNLFAGESAISSALLSLVAPEKPAILFVTCGAPATMPSFGGPFGGGGGGAYARIAERLRKSNFIVEDWDVLRSPEMPKPEHMTRAILVFIPPAPPNPQMPMPPPTPESYKPAIDAVKDGAPAVLLAEPATMFGGGTPYTELFDLFGVTAKTNAVAVHRQVVDAQGTERAVPQIEITRYADHAMTRTLNGLPTMFLTPCPVLVNKTLPEGVTAEAVVTLPAGPDYWADTNTFEATRGDAKRDEADDIIPTAETEVPLAVACTRKISEPRPPGSGVVGKDAEQKAVLFGDAQWAEDRVAFYTQSYLRGDTLEMRLLFPGNAELLVNSILWVSGTEHLITVSPEALKARRIGDPGAWTVPIQVLLMAGIPAAVLAAGIIVYAVRRRYN